MRLLVLSDIHANYPALKAVIDNAPSYDYVIFLGDSVDYGPHPNEVIEWLKENVDVAVMGNHDKAVAYNVDCMCGEKTHELSVYTRNAISFKLIRDENLKFLKKLPERKIVEIEGYRIYVVHGSPLNPLYGYVYPHIPEEKFRTLTLYEKTPFGSKREVNADLILIGHTHIQFKKKMNRVQIVNPGSVGQPRDGDPRASYSVIDLDNFNIRLYRTKYLVEETIKDLKKLGVKEKYLRFLINILTKGHIE